MTEIYDRYLSLELIDPRRDPAVHRVHLVVFVIDITHNLLDYILQSDDTLGTSVFIDHDGDMYFLFAEILEQVVKHPRLRDKIRIAKESLPVRTHLSAYIRKKVLAV